MNQDPYQILGITASATDEEVKAAYRAMARKYHPDNYTDNPLSDLAQEKMQEINEAYDTIIRMRKENGGASGRAGSGASYSGSSQFSDIRQMIQQNRIADAEMLLDGVPTFNRNAEWYFLKGSVLYQKGWLEDAARHFQTAYRMEPNNPEYRQAVNRTMNNRQTGGFRSGTGDGVNACDVCTTLYLADCCCECMGGDLIRCC